MTVEDLIDLLSKMEPTAFVELPSGIEVSEVVIGEDGETVVIK